jgi:hypothetical protein
MRKTAEQIREQAFIDNINRLDTLEVTRDGRMWIEPESIKSKVIKARKELKKFVVR